MSKECIKCKTITPDHAKVCTVCGGEEFVHFAVEYDPAEEPQAPNAGGATFYNQQQQIYNQNTQSFYPQGQQGYQPQNQQGYQPQNQQFNPSQMPVPPSNNPTWYQPVSAHITPKKNKKGPVFVIIGIILAVAVAIAAIAMTGSNNIDPFEDETTSSSKKVYDEYSDFDFDTTSANVTDFDIDSFTGTKTYAIPYTKGTFDGTTYINEWADIKVTLTNQYFNASESEYDDSEYSTIDYGFIFKTKDLDQYMAILFEDTLNLAITEEKYLDISVNNAAATLDYKTIGEYSKVNVGGYTYTYVAGMLSDFYYDTYVRKVDDYMICFVVMYSTAGQDADLLNLITTAN